MFSGGSEVIGSRPAFLWPYRPLLKSPILGKTLPEPGEPLAADRGIHLGAGVGRTAGLKKLLFVRTEVFSSTSVQT